MLDTTAIMVDGPERAPAQVILAHGAGAAMDSEFMNQIAAGLADGGLRVVRFEFPYMAKRRKTGKARPPDRAPVLEQAWRDVVRLHAHPRLVIGGKSMGGRIAARIAADLPVKGVVCLGFPFHPVKKPAQTRLEDLARLDRPTLILQGTRDPFGTREEVDGYALPRSVQLCWLADGDHSFVPRARSGRTAVQNLDEAVRAIRDFVHRLREGGTSVHSPT